jgi:sialate O-acetylesterase
MMLRFKLFSRCFSLVSLTALMAGAAASASEVRLSALDLSDMTLGYGERGINSSGANTMLSINGRTFVYGVGTHANSSLILDLKGDAKRFTALVGADDVGVERTAVVFNVLGDGKVLWTSGVMKLKEAAKAVDVDLTGVKTLELDVGTQGDSSRNWGDWADAVITYTGQAPAPPARFVANIFGDNMVLQRNQPVPVWGSAKPGEAVQVKFGKQVKKVKTDNNGNWQVLLDAMPANKIGQDMVVTAAQTVTFKNVLVGEVWLCSGQSNMEVQVHHVLNADNEIKAADSMVHFIKIPDLAFSYLRKDFIKSAWNVATPATAGDCTAVGYFFGRELAKQLDVPVGLISSNWSNTNIEPWINRAGLAMTPELQNLISQADNWSSDTGTGRKWSEGVDATMKAWVAQAEKAQVAKEALPAFPKGLRNVNISAPVRLYESMISPLVPYALRGTIWYQGESNGGEGQTYVPKMQALVGGWRAAWKEGDFPFYWVQLANLGKSDSNKPDMGDGWARLREAQLKSLPLIPHSGMAVTIDIGEGDQIHPRDKQDVGKRLAAWALAKDYGKKIEDSGPTYQKCIVKGAKIYIAFDHVGGGLMIGEKTGLDPVKEIPNGKLKWISIAGEDKQFHWAEAVIEGKNLVVSSDQVPHPVAVRYAFTSNPTGPFLYNKDGFPASPFRTDDWEIGKSK